MREYLLTILVAALVAYLLTPTVRKFAVWFGAQAAPRDRDVHVIPTPRLGGLAMFGGMVAALVVATGLPEMRKVLATGNVNVGQALLLSGGLIVLVGIADDRWGVDPLTKFAGQVAAAGIFIMQGIQIYSIPLPTSGDSLSLPPAYGVPLTVLVVVATINAVNFIDGLDGLAAGVVGIAALALFTYAYLLSKVNGNSTLSGATLTAAVLVGMCAGFLPHNFNPARIFMGDTGSMLIGLLLSASTIMLAGQFDPAVLRNGLFPFWVPILLVPAVAAVPFIDMLLAVWRRTNQGRSPFAPDKLHLHHRLLELGHSHRRAVLIMYFWVGLLASSVVGFALIDAAWITFGVLVAVAVAGIVVMLAVPGRGRRARRRRGAEVEPDGQDRPAERPRLPV